MDAKTFIATFGVAEATRVAVAAKTNYAYFSQIAYGHRRPSVNLANRLVKESGDRLDFVMLLNSPAQPVNVTLEQVSP